MKNTFKLAAIAVSMALATSFVACSSGDDVVDASTPEYLLTAQIDKYVESLGYDQNVLDADIRTFEDKYKEIKTIGDGCTGCLENYFKELAKTLGTDPLDSDDIRVAKTELGKLKTKYSNKNYHEVYVVYKPAIEKALEGVDKSEVEKIGGDNKILDGKLNSRQSANMSAYIDAAAALKSVLNDTDKAQCNTTIDAANAAINKFKNLNNSNVTTAEITKVIDAVDAMKADIQTKVVDAIKD